ncbi:hypothetical protein NG701_19220 [Pseudarthrobacter sp. HLT3-5]|uniref:hypothetical protein n=1 Tax=Pseudarthrobacter cellobiosi TaxID=2953654 RepID=UPI00208F5EF5|nr:hypothetical protein [Pseudarthrobacter sp. HLT3-5]MCO4276521.1 hypothetical protein [Pseudarthrobacter sp. HLT3-5]
MPNWLAAPAPDISHGPRRQTALQAGLRSALTAPHDSERGSAAATAALLSDDHGIILARRILDAARAMRDLCGGRR